MNIAIFGGTGKLGKAASRIHHTGHAVLIGSRDRIKATEAAKEVGLDVLADTNRVLRQIDLSHDVLVAGGARRKAEALEFIRSLQLRSIDAGPIEVAGHLERMTTLLLSINKANKVKESGIHITGI